MGNPNKLSKREKGKRQESQTSQRCTLKHGCIQTSHQKGTYATKQASGPKDQQTTNPQRENGQEHGRGLDLSKQAWTQK